MKKVEYWRGKWTCIGGGSSGLGLVLARQLVRQGANVAIIGRDPKRLERAVENLKAFATASGASGIILSFSVDLAASLGESSTDDVGGAKLHGFKLWRDWLDVTKLDLAIAAAGKSDRGYLSQITNEDVKSLFETNVVTSLVFSQTCEDSLARSGGTLVHVASLAGIVASPGMGAYSIAKHAVVALSRQLRLELARKGVKVLLVCPGPIKNSDHEGRYVELVKRRELPEELARPAAGNKITAIEADSLAEQILRAVSNGTKELVLPRKVQWLVALGTLFPSFTDYMLKKRSKS